MFWADAARKNYSRTNFILRKRERRSPIWFLPFIRHRVARLPQEMTGDRGFDKSSAHDDSVPMSEGIANRKIGRKWFESCPTFGDEGASKT